MTARNNVTSLEGVSIANRSQSSNADVSGASLSIIEQPMGVSRYVRIITIGAGASGLNVARTIRKHLDNVEHIVYEKNPDVGGTWYENRYPGCKCDIPSHNYQFSWRPNPEWSAFFAGNQEIHGYLKTICDEEHLGEFIRLSHEVIHAQWSEDEGLWYVKVRNLESGHVIEDQCHFLLDGAGILNHWVWPKIKELETFKGELVHTANWPNDFTYKSKRVAVIGNGSSGVQVVPAIQPDVKELVHFIRSPTWVVPEQVEGMKLSSAAKVMSEVQLNGDQFSPATIKRFKEDPSFYQEFVKETEIVMNSKFNVLVNTNEIATSYKALTADYMRKSLNQDQRLIDAMVPDFPFGCRRITPGIGYLESLQKENVRVVTDAIAKIEPTGLRTTAGELIPVDAIICATGFNVSFVPRFPLYGRDGNLQEIWSKKAPEAYMSCAVPGVPNYFMFMGPNAPIGHGSVLTITEHVAKYIVKIIRKCQTQGIKSVTVRQDVVDDFSRQIKNYMPRTAWAGKCRSWFKNGTETGPVTALHPGSRIHWFHMIEDVKGEDYEYTYLAPNKFQYLGNGYSIRELSGKDQTWYLDRPDELVTNWH